MMGQDFGIGNVTVFLKGKVQDYREKVGAVLSLSVGSAALKADGTIDDPVVGPDGRLSIIGRVANITRTVVAAVAYADVEVVPRVRASVAASRDAAIGAVREGLVDTLTVGVLIVATPILLAHTGGSLVAQEIAGRVERAKTEFDAFCRDLSQKHGADVLGERASNLVSFVGARLNLGNVLAELADGVYYARLGAEELASATHAEIRRFYVQVVSEPATAWVARFRLGVNAALEDMKSDIPELSIPVVADARARLVGTRTVLADGALFVLYVYSSLRRGVVLVFQVLRKAVAGAVDVVTSVNGFLVSCAGIATRNRFDFRATANEIGRILSSIILSVGGRLYPESEMVRNAFNEWTPWVAPKESVSHTHYNAASIRSHYVRMTMNMANRLGRTLYSYQGSNSDTRRGIASDRVFYVPKDLQVPVRMPHVPAHGLVSVVDVDYYLDMHHFLAANVDNPVVLFTTIPRTAAGHQNNASWCFRGDGKLCTDISGGANFVHHIWHYTGDTLAVETDPDTPWFLKPFSLKVAYFAMETRSFDDLKAAVLLTPIARYTGLFAHFARYILNYKLLGRFDPIVRGRDGTVFAVVQAMYPDRETISIANLTLAPRHAATVPLNAFGAARIASEISSAGVNVSTVLSFLPSGPTARAEATVLASFIKHVDEFVAPQVSSVDVPSNSYENGNTYAGDEPVVPSMEKLFNPFDNGTFHPAVMFVNMADGVLHRVLIPQDKSRDKMPTAYANIMADFVAQIKRFAQRVLHPIDFEEVAQAQSTGSRMAAVYAAASIAEPYGRKEPSVFIKQEVTKEAGKPARVITQFATGDKMAYARYVLALMDVVKQLPAYAFKQPKYVADHISLITSDAVVMVGTDYSLFDATISRGLRELDIALFMALFDPIYHAELHELIYHHTHGKSRLPVTELYGKIKVDMGSSQRSGAMDTSLMNTLRNMFVAYAALRKAGFHDGDAWALTQNRGCFGGDDGIVGFPDGFPVNLYLGCVATVCKDYGLTIKEERYSFGVPFTFLGRFFGWGGDRNSMCDLKRQLMKLHYTPHNGTLYVDGVLSDERVWRVIYAKALSILATDRNTPIIGRWAKVVARVAEEDKYAYDEKDVDRETQYRMRVTDDDNWPNAERGWFSDVVAMYNEFNVATFEKWAEHAEECIKDKRWAEAKYAIRNPPACTDRAITPRIGVIMHGDTLGVRTNAVDALKDFVAKSSANVNPAGQPAGQQPASQPSSSQQPGASATSQGLPALSRSSSDTMSGALDPSNSAVVARVGGDGAAHDHKGPAGPRDRRTQRSARGKRPSGGQPEVRGAKRPGRDGGHPARGGAPRVGKNAGVNRDSAAAPRAQPRPPRSNAAAPRPNRGHAPGPKVEAEPAWLRYQPSAVVGPVPSPTYREGDPVEPTSPSYYEEEARKIAATFTELKVSEPKSAAPAASGKAGAAAAPPKAESTTPAQTLGRPVLEAKSPATPAEVAAGAENTQRPAVDTAGSAAAPLLPNPVPSGSAAPQRSVAVPRVKSKSTKGDGNATG